METLLAAVVGGVVALASVYLASHHDWRNELKRRKEDRNLELASNALAALQRLVRATIDIAYIDLPPRSAGLLDSPQQAQSRAVYEDAVTEWNVAMYAVLVGADPELAQSVRRLDIEAERLVDEALDQVWSRDEFRSRRERVGRAMALHVDLARSRADLEDLGLTSIWTWDSDRLGG